jgi:hypothetical protein
MDPSMGVRNYVSNTSSPLIDQGVWIPEKELKMADLLILKGLVSPATSGSDETSLLIDQLNIPDELRGSMGIRI